MPTNLVNDGDVSYGSRVLTIATVTYVADDFGYDTDSKSVTRTNEKDVPSGRVNVIGEKKGSATLQLATSATALPKFGDQCTVTEGVLTVLNVGRKETKNGETKVPITFVVNITTSITSS